jgi:hypothetical protein
MEQFLSIRPFGPGPLFIKSNGCAVIRSDLVNILKTCVGKLGLDSTLYNSHSLRIGSTTDLALAGTSLAQLKVIGRWSSDAFQKYVRPVLIRVPN